jgi:hypothetical protein
MGATKGNLCLATSLMAALVACGGDQDASGTAGGGSASDDTRDTAPATKQPSAYRFSTTTRGGLR